MSFSNLHTPSPANIYYDCVVTNRDSDGSLPKRLSYFETRNCPFLHNPQNYVFSIVRMSLDTPSLPVFIPTVQLNTNNPNDTIYSITLEYMGIDSGEVFIEWVPQYTNASIPENTDLLQDNSGDYYHCYSYAHWITCINTAFKLAMSNLLATYALLHNGSITTFPSPTAPFMSWDVLTNRASLSATVGSAIGGFQSNVNKATYNNIKIYFNTAMYQLFNSFDGQILFYGAQSDNYLSNVLIPLNFNGSNLTNMFTDVILSQQKAFITVKQETSTISFWNPVMSIVFTTATIPIIPENTGTPYVFSGGSVIQVGNNSNIASVITDFQVGSGEYRPYIQYTPSIYRYCDLVGNGTLNTIDFNVFWKDRTGRLNIFNLVTGASCTIKLMFRLKDSLS